MKIKKHGAVYAPKTKRETVEFTCAKCGCVFEDEVSINDKNIISVYSTCPECHSQTRALIPLEFTPEEKRVMMSTDKSSDKHKIYDFITEKNVPDTEEFKKEYERNATFKMTEIEYMRFKQFMIDHKHPHLSRGCSGGGYTVEFSPNGIGTGVSVKCFCGGSANITDYSCW